MGKQNFFLRDLVRGGKVEQLVCDMFTASGFSSMLDKQARSDWDIVSEYGQAEKLSFTTEVKFDEYENRSGNVAMEVYNPRSGNPSGITATKAFFWAHVLVNSVIWVTPVEKLKDYLDNHEPSRIIDRGGDNNATLWLYPSDQLLPEAFTQIDTMTVDELREFILENMEVSEGEKR